MNEELKKPYNPKEVEEKIYKQWEEGGYFNPDVCIEKGLINLEAPTFSMVLPPPNVTGSLHIGHAFEDSLQDVVVRYKRMKGLRTLWIPGTDHAAIATQSKVEKILEKEGLKRKELGREKFLAKTKEFAETSKNTIVSQIRRMGASLDWSREAFTLDKKREFAVKTAFKKLFDLGLIYRGYKVINWDPKGQTVISDDEVVHEERSSQLYTFKYWSDFPIYISTTRPETKIGDVAVAVNPKDPRYQKFIGQIFEGDFVGYQLKIKIIGDHTIDPEFGTGAVGITPTHSQIDAEIADRHQLEGIPVIDQYAKISIGPLAGLKTIEARQKIIDQLKDSGLLEKEEEIKINISLAERTGGVIEPLPKLQWFIAVNKPLESGKTLKNLMQEAVSEGEIRIIPENFEKIYYNWIDNLRDWCISRQIWYGHQIPVWYRGEEVWVDTEDPEGEGWVQDEDTLDTWFSSALWTFSTLGWPGETQDLKDYHPTSLMAPGYEILFFWVARMILMSKTLLGNIPFRTVYIHGIVRDKNGNKFSKSAGNGVDPIEVIEEYGADALRMALLVGVGPGNDSKYDQNKVKAYKHFANKIWNASRFVLEQTAGQPIANIDQLTEADRKILEDFASFLKDLTSDMENYRFYLASEKIYHYFWHTFADKIIEDTKERIRSDQEAESARFVLIHLLENQLKVLHPFMPFITEKIWSLLPNRKNLLIVEKWPD